MSHIANPEQVIVDFCNDFDLDEVKETLSQLVECAITTENWHFNEAKDRKGLLFFQTELKEIFEAIFTMAKQKEK